MSDHTLTKEILQANSQAPLTLHAKATPFITQTPFMSQKTCKHLLELRLGKDKVWLKQTSTKRDAAYLQTSTPKKGEPTTYTCIAVGTGWADVYANCLNVFAEFEKDQSVEALTDSIVASKHPQVAEPLSDIEVMFNAHVDSCTECTSGHLCVTGNAMYEKLSQSPNNP